MQFKTSSHFMTKGQTSGSRIGYWSIRTQQTLLRITVCLSLVVMITPATFAIDKTPAATVVQVESPYLDLQTGPGRGYPVLHSVLKGEQVRVLYQRAGYVKVRTVEDIESKSVEGWVKASALVAAQSGTTPTVTHR
jgi:uncharacterized protein YgiM (DUF1202 family)